MLIVGNVKLNTQFNVLILRYIFNLEQQVDTFQRQTSMPMYHQKLYYLSCNVPHFQSFVDINTNLYDSLFYLNVVFQQGVRDNQRYSSKRDILAKNPRSIYFLLDNKCLELIVLELMGVVSSILNGMILINFYISSHKH